MVERKEIIGPHYIAEVRRGGEALANELGGKLESRFASFLRDEVINREAFPDLESYESAIGWETLHQITYRLNNQDVTFILLRDREDRDIIGFTLFFPASMNTNYSWYAEEVKHISQLTGSTVTNEAFAALQAQTAETGFTYIRPYFRGKGHGDENAWSFLMNQMDAAMVDSGFLYQSRMVRTDDRYHQKIKRRYGQSIVYESAIQEEELFGNQLYFRIATSPQAAQGYRKIGIS